MSLIAVDNRTVTLSEHRRLMYSKCMYSCINCIFYHSNDSIQAGTKAEDGFEINTEAILGFISASFRENTWQGKMCL